jgi:Na+/proline symporter
VRRDHPLGRALSPLDWVVLFGHSRCSSATACGAERGERDSHRLPARRPHHAVAMVALSVMATQASAITFLSTPGQGYADGMRFVQFYFGLPLAMVVLCVLAIPIYHRLKVFTAYQYSEERFDGKTRTLPPRCS